LKKLKKKSKSITYYKKKAWALFSEKIRRRGADHNGFNFCVTCGKIAHWKDLQAGRFIDGRNNSILFDERGVHPQCLACNIFKSGNKVEYFRFMQEKYGDKVIDELRIQAKQPKTIKIFEYQEMIEKLGDRA